MWITIVCAVAALALVAIAVYEALTTVRRMESKVCDTDESINYIGAFLCTEPAGRVAEFMDRFMNRFRKAQPARQFKIPAR